MTYYELAQMIDKQGQEVTSWESRFLNDMLSRGRRGRLSTNEQAKLREMGEAYLPHHVMAEFNGQQSLFL